MKCPDCGHDLAELGGGQPGPLLPPTTLYCSQCNKRWNPGELPCQHEPANFSAGYVDIVTWPGCGVDAPMHVCRLCGVFYTDIDAIRLGEKQYDEARGKDA